MWLKSLRLKGFKGFRSGVGLDEVFIDFNDLSNGLIAITGTNGIGKTTLIDNMHPFRMMPYKLRKAKEWSPNAFSYYKHCYGNASKELIFGINGDEYRSLVLIDVDKNKQEAYLYLKTDGQWVPLNDGKTKTYDMKVEEIVGSPRLFFTSVFRSQGAKKLSEYSRSDIMKIISELLNIDHIKEQGDKAKTVVDAIKRIRDEALNRVSLLENELSEFDKLEIVLKGKSLDISKTHNLLSESKSFLESKSNEISELEKKQAIQESVVNRLKDLEKTQSQDQNELRVLTSETKKVNDDTTIRQAEVLQWHKNEVTNTETEISSSTALLSSLDKKFKHAKEIIGRENEIKSKVEEERGLRAMLDDLKLQLSGKDADRERLDKDKERLNEIQRCITKAESQRNLEFNKAKIAVNNAKKEADKLSGVNCTGSGQINESCRFIKDAVEAKNNLPLLIDKLNDVQKPDPEVIRLNTEKDSLSGSVSMLDTCNSDIKALKIKIASVEGKISELASWVTMLSEVNNANENIAQWLKEQAGIDIRLDSLKVKLSRIDIEKEGKLGNILGNAQSEIEKISKKIGVITLRINGRDKEITEIRSSFSEDVANKIRELKDELARLIGDRSSLDDNLQRLHVELGAVKSKIDALISKGEEVKNLKNRVSVCNSEITNWNQVFRACSNDGIIALEIDDAGPTISAITNELLTACYGSRFSIRFETQSEKATGEMREDFDILVFDSEANEEKSIEDMSDGQITWLEDALTRGICLYNINKSGRHFHTLFSDEKDGALDEIKKMEFLAVKRKAIKIGGYEREFFITQSSELTEITDSRIVLEKGTICIN